MSLICAAYIVVAGGPKTTGFVERFVSTWLEHPPGVNTDVLAICNGGAPTSEQGTMLSMINAKCFVRANDKGFDISGYIEASKGPLSEYDFVLCLGESVHFHRAGWLKRLWEVKSRHGEGMYGPFGSHVIRAHLQTTSFGTSPRLLREYPLLVTDRASRMEFEHGERSFWRFVQRRKHPVKMVTWDGAYDPGQWRTPKNILWKGDQSNLLWCSNHTENYQNADEKRKRSWQLSADRPFR